MAFKLRRHYGQYDDDIEILEGQYIFPETTRAVAEAYIEKHSGGRLPSPERYFDMEIFYSRGDGILWHVAHGPRGEVTRSMFPVDATMQHMFAALIREKTALLPVSLEGKLLAVVSAERAGEALELLRSHPLGARAAEIGEVTEAHGARVIMKTSFGGSRILTKLAGAQLPRIC